MSVKNSSSLSKKEVQTFHAMKRFRERYGGHLDMRQISFLIQSVRNQTAIKLKHLTNRVSAWCLPENNLITEVRLVFLYDRLRKSVITFLASDITTEEIGTYYSSLSSEEKFYENVRFRAE